MRNSGGNAAFWWLVSLAVAGLCLSAPRVQAAGYGKNKVQTRALQWRVLTTPDFDLHFHDGAEELAVRAAIIAERARVAAQVAGIVLILAFALAGAWIAYGIDGYQIAAMPALDAPPNPLAKDVVTGEGNWLANYVRYPWMIAAPVLGGVNLFGGVGGVGGTVAGAMGARVEQKLETGFGRPRVRLLKSCEKKLLRGCFAVKLSLLPHEAAGGEVVVVTFS